MNTTTHPLVDDYLRRLDRAAQRLPRDDRNELVAEIRSHLDAGLSPDPDEAEVRNLLATLGSPEDIVAAAGPLRPPQRRGVREIAALLLLVTGFPPVIGWLAGAALLLWSPLWTRWQKALGLLVWPGGAFAVAGLGVVTARVGSCTGPVTGSEGTLTCTDTGPVWPSAVLTAVLVLAPLAVAVYLYVAAGRQSDSP